MPLSKVYDNLKYRMISKKEFLVIFVLSVVIMYMATIVDVLLNGSIIAGKSGFPFKFDSSSPFAGSNIDYPMLLINIFFWFIVIWAIWKFIYRRSGRGGRSRKR